MKRDPFDYVMNAMFCIIGLVVVVLIWLSFTSWHLAQDRCIARGAEWKLPGICSDGVRYIIKDVS